MAALFQPRHVNPLRHGPRHDDSYKKIGLSLAKVMVWCVEQKLANCLLYWPIGNVFQQLSIHNTTLVSSKCIWNVVCTQYSRSAYITQWSDSISTNWSYKLYIKTICTLNNCNYIVLFISISNSNKQPHSPPPPPPPRFSHFPIRLRHP